MPDSSRVCFQSSMLASSEQLMRMERSLNPALLLHALARRNWRDLMWSGLPTLRVFVVVMAITFGLLFVLVTSFFWYDYERDVPRVIGGWAYFLAPIWTLYILVRAEEEYHPAREHSPESVGELVLVLGRPAHVCMHLLSEPLAVISYRCLRPASLLLLAAIGSFLTQGAVAAMVLGGMALLFSTCASYLLIGLVARTRYELRVGIVAYWLVIVAAYVVIALRIPILQLLHPMNIYYFFDSLAPSAFPAMLIQVALSWAGIGVAAVAASWYIIRYRTFVPASTGGRRRPPRLQARELALADIMRAAFDGDIRLGRDHFRRLSAVAGYVILGLIPLVGWIVVVTVYEWLLASRVKSLVGTRTLDEVRLLGLDSDELGKGVRDTMVREARLVTPGLAVALSALGLWTCHSLIAMAGAPSALALLATALFVPIAYVIAKHTLLAISVVALRYVPNAVSQHIAHFPVSFAFLGFSFAPDFILNRPGIAGLSIAVYVAVWTFATLLARRSQSWKELGEWLERDELPKRFSIFAMSEDEKCLLGPEYYRQR